MARFGHPSAAEWALHLDERLEPAVHAKMSAHLESCGRCQRVRARVEAVQGIMATPIPEPDELSWRRMEARLRQAVQDRPQEVYPRRGRGIELPNPLGFRRSGDSHDGFRGRRWLGPGLAAAVVVAVFIAVAPPRRPVPRLDAPPAGATRGRAALIRSGADSFEITVRSGHRIEVRSWTELSLPALSHLPPRIQLDQGEVAVRVPLPVADGAVPTVLVRTPEADVFAQSADFVVAYQAGQHRVEVRHGHADVEGSGWQQRVGYGEKRMFSSTYNGPAEPSLQTIDGLRSAPHRDGQEQAARPRANSTAPPERERAARAPKGRRPSPSPRGVPRGEEGSEARLPRPAQDPQRSEGLTKVERISSVVTEPERALVDARKAWYIERDAEKTIEAAERVLGSSDDATLRVSALELSCDARVSAGDGHAAADTCGTLLRHERDPERRRRIHYTLATMYRNHLRDCRTAIEHYGKALVFGARSQFNDTVRLRRAECALRVGDYGLARTDLESLRGRSTEVERVKRARDRLRRLEKKGHERSEDNHEDR